MNVINIHKRTINQPKEKVSQLFKTLATANDLVWPYENWPAIKFKDGLQVGSKGGHGRVRYTIIDFIEGEFIKFQFSKPDGFNGTHALRIETIGENKTEIIHETSMLKTLSPTAIINSEQHVTVKKQSILSHEIRMNTSLKATFLWFFIIRWLHDALIEDAFDKVENYFSTKKKTTRYNAWVKYLRAVYKRKSFQTNKA